jgi:hypothetical protein
VDVDLKNKFLLSKWLYKLLNEDGVWQELLHKKYLQSKTLSQVSAKPNDPPCLEGFNECEDRFIFSRVFRCWSKH